MLNYLFFLLITDVHPDSVLFSIGIAEHFIRREKMLQFLKSGETEAEKGGLDITVLYNLMGLHEMSQQAFIPSLIYPSSEFNTQKPLLDFVGGLAWSSKITVQPDGRVLFTGTGTEMEHLLSVVAEFYSLRNSVCWKKQSVLVPHFNRYAWTIIKFGIFFFTGSNTYHSPQNEYFLTMFEYTYMNIFLSTVWNQ